MIRINNLPPEWGEQHREERRQARQAAGVFVRTCKDGRADSLYDAATRLHECGSDAWRLAMVGVARLPSVTPEIRAAFLPIWIETKMLPLRVGDRRVLADALRILLPGDYSGPPLTLYRGASAQERRRHRYGFSWTTDIAVARKFAEHWARPLPGPRVSQGVLLKTLAPPEAILLIRQPEDFYYESEGPDDEGEVVVDPFRLGRIDLVERLRAENGGGPANVTGGRGRD